MTTQKPVANAESEQIDELLKRPALYRNVDGTEEISIGILGLSLASMRFIYPLFEGTFLGGGVSWWLFMMVVGGLMHFGSKAVKKRLTYPRTGFVEPRCTNRGGKWLVLVAIGLGSGGVSAVATLIALGRIGGGPALVACGGVVTAVAFAFGIGKRVPWKRWTAVALAAGSLAIAFLPAGFLASIFDGVKLPAKLSPGLLGAFFLYGAWMGVVFLSSGLITLWQYIRSTRSAEPDAE
jgi:hypothetical protein